MSCLTQRATRLVLFVCSVLASACASQPKAPYTYLSDGSTGQSLSHSELRDAIAKTRHIYVGERHESPADHFVQLEVLKQTHKLNQGMVIGIEWLPHTLQSKLNAKRPAPNVYQARVCLLDVGNGLTCRGGTSEAIRIFVPTLHH